MEDKGKRHEPIIGFLKESLCLGGTERSAANISKLFEKKYRLYFILFNGLDVKYSYGGNLIDIKAPPKKTKIAKVVNSFVRLFKVRKAIRRYKIDILYEFITVENFLSHVTYGRAKRIISARDCGKMKRKPGAFHNALLKASAMICNSEYIKNYYLELYPEDKEKVFAVYNIINNEEIIRQSVEDVEEEFLEFTKKHRKNISVVGRFCREKGFEYLLEAFASVVKRSDVGLIMIGDGEYKAKYEAVIEKFKIQGNVYFTNFQSNPYKYMAKSDVFVLSSLSEGFPNVIVEAMTLGLPVVSTNCYSGPAEILREDCDYEAVVDKYVECDYGIITPRIEGDIQKAVEELSNALNFLLNNDELLEKYSALSKSRVKKYSEEAVEEKFEEIIKKISS